MSQLLDGEAEERRLDLERTLMDADRMMMQTVQTSLSLIGFGFTINTFFNDVVDAANGGDSARALGIALLSIGLLLLTQGTWTQARFRRDLLRRYAGIGVVEARAQLRTRLTPSFISAVLLMFVGLAVLGLSIFRWLL